MQGSAVSALVAAVSTARHDLANPQKITRAMRALLGQCAMVR